MGLCQCVIPINTVIPTMSTTARILASLALIIASSSLPLTDASSLQTTPLLFMERKEVSTDVDLPKRCHFVKLALQSAYPSALVRA